MKCSNSAIHTVYGNHVPCLSQHAVEKQDYTHTFGNLPYTGIDLAVVAVAAVLLLALGATLLRAGRRA